MLDVREIQARTREFFVSKGVPNPKLDTDLLVAHILGIKRLEIYLDLDRPLNEAQVAELRGLVKRRANREPVQYILGWTEFCGLRLKVDPRALIPRHETEELVEFAEERLAQAPERILDLGTGSGALALALASKYPKAVVTATDSSPEALALARENVLENGFEDRIRFLEGNWFEPVPEGERFDLIVANPPYLTEAEMDTAEPEVRVHEPSEALVAGPDGLDDLRAILGRAPDFLDDEGLLALETGIAQGDALRECGGSAGLSGDVVEDLSGRPRFYFAAKST